jgi:hypothetical protein
MGLQRGRRQTAVRIATGSPPQHRDMLARRMAPLAPNSLCFVLDTGTQELRTVRTRNEQRRSLTHAIVPISVMRTGAPMRILGLGVVMALIAGARKSMWARIVALFPENEKIILLGTTITFVRC